jgi:hypothetical protein
MLTFFADFLHLQQSEEQLIHAYHYGQRYSHPLIPVRESEHQIETLWFLFSVDVWWQWWTFLFIRLCIRSALFLTFCEENFKRSWCSTSAIVAKLDHSRMYFRFFWKVLSCKLFISPRQSQQSQRLQSVFAFYCNMRGIWKESSEDTHDTLDLLSQWTVSECICWEKTNSLNVICNCPVRAFNYFF